MLDISWYIYMVIKLWIPKKKSTKHHPSLGATPPPQIGKTEVCQQVRKFRKWRGVRSQNLSIFYSFKSGDWPVFLYLCWSCWMVGTSWNKLIQAHHIATIKNTITFFDHENPQKTLPLPQDFRKTERRRRSDESRFCSTSCDLAS